MIKPEMTWVRLASAILSVFLITFTLHAVRGGVSAAPDYECVLEGQEVDVQVPAGTSGSALAKILVGAGVTKSESAYFRLAVSDKRSEQVAPGSHTLTAQNCASNVLDELLDSKRIKDLITIVEGAWNSEIAAQMVKAGFSGEEVKSALRSYEIPDGFKSMEGLFFPALYSFDKKTTATQALEAMVTRAMSEFDRAGIFNASGKYSPSDLLIMASIIQAEGDTKDFSKISRVIRNRLEKGMPLQMDSTVHYIKKVRGSVFLSTASTFLKSEYNTYRRYGLPPGPIGNPGAKALKASVNPQDGEWLYFITVAPGDTRFTSSIDEFNNWKVLYKSNLRKGLFRSSK